MSSNNTTQRRKFGRSNTAAGRTRRVMARNNMRRAVERLQRDLEAVIDAAPENDATLRTLVAVEMRATLLAIAGLWEARTDMRSAADRAFDNPHHGHINDSDEDAGGR